MIVQNKHII